MHHPKGRAVSIHTLRDTGVVRRLDALGRVTVPAEFRRLTGIPDRGEVEMIVRGGELVVRRHAPYCCICGETKDLVRRENVLICAACVTDMAADLVARSLVPVG